MKSISERGAPAVADGDVSRRASLPPCHGMENDQATLYPDLTEDQRRVFRLDASFELGGAWAGVEPLIEAAYLSLQENGHDEIIEQHLPRTLFGTAETSRPDPS